MIDDQDLSHGLPEYILGKTKLLSKRRGALRQRSRVGLNSADRYLLSHLRSRYGSQPFVRGNLDAGRLNRLIGREIILFADDLHPRSPRRLLRLVARGQDWTAIECYFAVWAYDFLDRERLSTKSLLYQELADLLRRSANSIRRKVENVSHFDTRPRAEKAVGASKNAQGLLGEVFNWYWPDRAAARRKYGPMTQQLEFGMDASPFDLRRIASTDDGELLIEEGGTVSKNKTVRRRSRALLLYARRHFRRQNAEGKLQCRSCDFGTPQSIAPKREIVQLHHTRPIYELGPKGRRISLRDAMQYLIPLCPTCHQIAHTYRPPMDVGQIRGIRKAG